MNSDQVEDAAVNAIRNKIEQEDTLIPEISVRDKTPSFDGFISLINPKIMNKGNFIGRVPVQIKGRSVVKLTLSNQRCFGISKLDLNNL